MPPNFSSTDPAFANHRFRVQRASPELPGDSTAAPAKTATVTRPACDRCRRLKKRCSRSLPDCAACIHAGRRCSFEVLQARVQELTQYVTELEQERVTGIVTQHEPCAAGETATAAATAIATRAGDTRTADTRQPQPQPQSQTNTPWTVTQSPGTGAAVTPARVEIPDPSVLVDAFFHHEYRAYPFIDEERVRKASVACVPDSRDTDAIVSCSAFVALHLCETTVLIVRFCIWSWLLGIPVLSARARLPLGLLRRLISRMRISCSGVSWRRVLTRFRS